MQFLSWVTNSSMALQQPSFKFMATVANLIGPFCKISSRVRFDANDMGYFDTICS